MSYEQYCAARQWAARGFRVFRLKENSKFPLPGSQWVTTASSDPEAITAMWTDEATGDYLDGNIGVLCDDFVVVDVDVKHEGAMEALLDLDIPLDTLTVRTPSGGLHVYYHGANVSLSTRKLGPGIDIRSYHGYTLAPGSTINGREYRLETDTPTLRAPQHLVDKCDKPGERSVMADVPLVAWDLPANIEQARQYLRAAPLALQGQGGDATTFAVASELRDYAVSEDTCLTLLLTEWNERCSPPWDSEELAKKVANAYRYSQNQPGTKAGTNTMGGISLPDMPAFRSSIADYLAFRPFTPAKDLPKRPWVMKGLLCRRVVTVLSAQGGSGKTGLTAALAAHVATGQDYAGFQAVDRCKVLLMSLEEDMTDLDQRMYAACDVFGMDPAVVAASVAMVPRTDGGWKIATGRNPIIQNEEIDALATFCRNAGIGVILVDPFRKIHQSDENDTTSMDMIVDAFTRLAVRANAAILVCHHVGKRSDKASIAGDAGAARGASSIIDAARLAFTLVNATDKDVELGVPRNELKSYVRLDMSKANLVKMSDEPVWFVKYEVTLPNTETSFAMKPVIVKQDRTASADQLARLIRSILVDNGTMRLKLHEVAKQVNDRDPIWGVPGKNETTAKKVEAAKQSINKHIGFDGYRIDTDEGSFLIKRDAKGDQEKGETTHFVQMDKLNG